MNQHLRERINRKLDTLSDERAYQILDFIEFLESKYAVRQNPDNVFTRFADTVEDGLRAGRIPATAIAESMNLMNKAMGVLNGVAAAGKSVASDIVATAREAGKQVSDLTKRDAQRFESSDPSMRSRDGMGSGSYQAQADGTPAGPGEGTTRRGGSGGAEGGSTAPNDNPKPGEGERQ